MKEEAVIGADSLCDAGNTMMWSVSEIVERTASVDSFEVKRVFGIKIIAQRRRAVEVCGSSLTLEKSLPGI